jgi:hypothetical protein
MGSGRDLLGPPEPPGRPAPPKAPGRARWALAAALPFLAVCGVVAAHLLGTGQPPSATPAPAAQRPAAVTPTSPPLSVPPASAPVTSSPPSTETTPVGPVPPQLVRAIQAFMSAQGVPSSSYAITQAVFSSVDASWARFALSPRPAGSAQAGVGLAHASGGAWQVVSFGTAMVGCGAVPAAVLASFGMGC